MQQPRRASTGRSLRTIRSRLIGDWLALASKAKQATGRLELCSRTLGHLGATGHPETAENAAPAEVADSASQSQISDSAANSRSARIALIIGRSLVRVQPGPLREVAC